MPGGEVRGKAAELSGVEGGGVLPTVREGNVFRGVCQSFRSHGVGYPPLEADILPRGRPPLEAEPI